MKTGERFWDAMNKSIVVRSILALLVCLAICYLAIAGREVPEVLTLGFGTILGFFFGARAGQQTERIQASNAVIRARLDEVVRDA